MNYGSAQDHADAVLELLRAVPNLTVYPEEAGGNFTVPNGAPPRYVSVHMTADRPLGGRLDMRSTRFRQRIYTHSVGENDIAARAVADLVSGALLDVVPFVDGRVCYPIRSEVGGDPREDESANALVVTITDTWRLESEPGRDGS